MSVSSHGLEHSGVGVALARGHQQGRQGSGDGCACAGASVLQRLTLPAPRLLGGAGRVASGSGSGKPAPSHPPATPRSAHPHAPYKSGLKVSSSKKIDTELKEHARRVKEPRTINYED